MGWLTQTVKAIGATIWQQRLDLLQALALPIAKQAIHEAVAPETVPSAFMMLRPSQTKGVDGATLDGYVPGNAYAKYALPKGLPTAGQRVLAIENDPHQVNGFDGVIEEGYGKGIKSLLIDDTVIVKIGRKTFPGRLNYHFHQADVAGPHYDLVVEGVPPGTKQWEMHIARGPQAGRYAFVTTAKGMLVVPMKDEGVRLAKPDYSLRDRSFLQEVDNDPNSWIVERKLDGSLGNVAIRGHRATFRSHRDTGKTYYDRLPQLEHIDNQSRFGTYRIIMPGPRLDGTILQGELVHPDGVGRMGGILNAHPDRARQIQALRGEATFHGWDIVKYKGRDVSRLPYQERRALLEKAVSEVRLYNRNWNVVDRPRQGETATAFYDRVSADVLPFGEGVVVKRADDPTGRTWLKVKQTDYHDVPIVDWVEGTGKYSGSLGAIVVEDPGTGRRSEVGSFAISDQQRSWIWDHRGDLGRPVAKVRAQEVTSGGAVRAGVFYGFHEGKGSEAGLALYADTLAGGNPDEAKATMYRLKSSAGWRRAA